MLSVSLRSFALPVNTKEGIPRVPNLDITKPGNGSDLNMATLFFMKSCGMFYLGPSSDTVFPAEVQDAQGYWSSHSQHPRVLGCQESRTICIPDGACFDLDQLGSKSIISNFRGTASETSILKLLALSLSFSNIGAGDSSDSLGLLAERFHSGSLSTALGDEHW